MSQMNINFNLRRKKKELQLLGILSLYQEVFMKKKLWNSVAGISKGLCKG